jgi:predicted ArsR family transcriptional regulator
MARSPDPADRDPLARVAALGEPVRRELYRFVVAQHEPVSREQAAAGVGVAHHVAKFHLDKLAEDGLLDTEYRRPAGRTGPGAGRPTKLYRRADAEIAVNLPERRYDLAAHVMAEAIAESQASGAPVERTLHAAARRAGHDLGEAARQRVASRSGADAAVSAICASLAETGYEPQARGCDRVTLHNCPFHSVAAQYTELVCGMNLDVINGLLDAFGTTSLHARLEPAPDRCCVTLNDESP